MPFIKEIENYSSLSIVGLEKNTGKTECLNYVLSRMRRSPKQIALTSIGVDGESRDQVKQTHKPEIDVYEGMIFVTSETHYRQRRLLAEILDVGTQQTSLGRLVTARALTTGKVIISGPADNKGLIRLISEMKNHHHADITIIDGALSRRSLGSPAVSEAMILATGAALSSNIPQLVYKTRYMFDLINLPVTKVHKIDELMSLENGLWAINGAGDLIDLQVNSVMMIDKVRDRILEHGNRLFVSGAITDKFLNFIRNQKDIDKAEIIVRDFTRIFVSPEIFYAFIKKGGIISVLRKTRLIAVTINPVSPDGFRLNAGELKRALEEKLGLPVYDVKNMENVVA